MASSTNHIMSILQAGGAAAQGSTSSSPMRLPPLPNPNDVSVPKNMQTLVMQLNDYGDGDGGGTDKSYTPKIREFFHFCRLLYPESPSKYVLDFDKVYRFMFYTCFREQFPRGLSKAKRAQLARGEYFDIAKYREIAKHFEGPSQTSILTYPTPKKPINFQAFDTYMSVLKKIHEIQVAQGYNRHSWEQIYQQGLKNLKKHVECRKAKIQKENYEEKISAEFSPYALVAEYTKIENELWKDSQHSVGFRSIATSLRHRYALLHLTCGILRCESLYRAELSDFLGMYPPERDTDCHRMFIMINQFTFGKTNKGRKLYGRAARHRDVRVCAIGGLSFYLMYRFLVSHEFEDFTTTARLDE